MACWKQRQVHASASKDGGGNPSKKRKQFATTTCPHHGREVKGMGVGAEFKQVRCERPKTKHEKYTLGCPLCGYGAHA